MSAVDAPSGSDVWAVAHAGTFKPTGEFGPQASGACNPTVIAKRVASFAFDLWVSVKEVTGVTFHFASPSSSHLREQGRIGAG